MNISSQTSPRQRYGAEGLLRFCAQMAPPTLFQLYLTQCNDDGNAAQPFSAAFCITIINKMDFHVFLSAEAFGLVNQISIRCEPKEGKWRLNELDQRNGEAI